MNKKTLRMTLGILISAVLLCLAVFSALTFAKEGASNDGIAAPEESDKPFTESETPLPDLDIPSVEEDAETPEEGKDSPEAETNPDINSKPEDSVKPEETPEIGELPEDEPEEAPEDSPEADLPSADGTVVSPALPEAGGESEKDYLSDFLEIVKGELGVKEKKYNNVKYNTWYYGRVVRATSSKSSNYAWCVTFISWCANMADIDTSVIPKMNNAESLRKFYLANGQYVARKNAAPKAGDIIFFGSKSSNHAGVVLEVNDDQVTIVEGNFSDKVSLSTYSLTKSTILGYASPSYS